VLQFKNYSSLATPSVNGGGDRLRKVQCAEARDLDLESGHTAYRHASLIDLYVHYQISLKSDKLFVDGRIWTDGRTDVPTDGRTFPPLMLLGRLGGVDLTEADTPTIRLGVIHPD